MKIFNALILLIAMLFSSSSLYAEDFNVDGIYYNITHTSTNPSIVEVTYRGEGVSSYDNEYSGSIVIPETVIYEGEKYSVESIGESAFYHCSGLTSMTIPNSVTSIGNKAFWGCSGLTSIVVDEGNSVYDSRNNCNAIIETSTNTLIIGCKTTNIPNSVESIGESAFSGCSGLTSLTIPNSVTSIGDNASGDDRVTKLLGIMLGKTNDGAFSGCSGLTSIVVDEGNSVYDSRNNCNAIIETSTNTLVLGCTTTNIPNSVESIGERAFSNCSGLTSITIPNSVTSIGGSAFTGCKSLTSITIPNSVTSIGNSAFRDCFGLTSLTIPNSVTSIGAYAFSGCFGLTSLSIGNSVKSIGNNAFWGCSGLTSIVVDEGNSVCDSRNNCNAIIKTSTNTLVLGCKTTKIPNSVTSIGERAFSNCSGLTSITIPNSVTSIGGSAFTGCKSLTSITIPNSVTSIGERAFSNCSGLTSIVVDEGNSVYDSRNNCNAIIETSTNTLVLGCTTTNIPNSVESIGESAFSGCLGLTSLTLPNSVTSIGDNAFDGCYGLTSVTIPNSVTSIGNQAFWGCAKLKEVYVFADNPVECGNNLKKVSVFTRNSVVCGNLTVFSSETYSNANLYVPEASISSYKSTIPWSSFSRIKANPK